LAHICEEGRVTVNNKLGVLMIAAVSLILFSPQAAQAQAYPTKPVEIVCAWGPGTNSDLVARLIADISPKYLGQPMFVTNKTGATGSTAAADLIASRPDGYKLLANNHPYFATTIHTQRTPFDPHDIAPLANFVSARQGLLARADAPFKTFSDLINHGRKNPGQLKWSVPGRGVTLHMTPMLIFKKEGVTTIDVPYKGGQVEAVTALLGGHVDMSSGFYAGSVEHIKAGKLKFLIYYTDQRYPDSPEVPCAAELGYRDAILPAYTGLYIHKNTPEHIKKVLLGACKKIYDDPAFQKGLEKMDADPKWGGPEFLTEAIKTSEAIGVPVLKEIGLYVGR
jgi:tripartite-type tricarboxylate transporter receptor subunit TctC